MDYLNKIGIKLNKHVVIVIAFLCFIVWSFCFTFALTWLNRPFTGFLFYENLVISEIVIDLSDGEETKPNIITDRVIAINGERVNTPQEVYLIVNRYKVGTPLDYSILRGDEIFEYTLPVSVFNVGHFISIFGVVYFAGLIFFVVGISVYFLRPRLTTTKIFFLFNTCVGLWLVSYFDSQSTYLFDKLSTLGFYLAPTLAVYLSIVFPTDRTLSIKHYLFLAPLFILSVFLFALSLSSFNNYENWLILSKVMLFFALAASVLLAGSNLRTYFKSQNILDKQRSQIVLIGSLVGLFIPVSIMIITQVINHTGSFGILALVLTVFPISLAYSILKHKLFDVDVIIRKALVYGLLTGALGGVIAILIISFNLFLASKGGWRNPAFFIILSAFLAVALNPLQNKIQAIIDLIFFRKKYDYRKTVEDISFAMTSILNPEDISEKIVETIEKTIFAKNVNLFFYDEQQALYRPYSDLDSAERENYLLDEQNILIQQLKQYKSEIFLEDIHSEEKYRANCEKLEQVFSQFNSSIIIPMFVKDKLIGLMSLGEKKSDLTYTSEDLELLRILANQSSVAIENALAFRLVEDYARKLEDANLELRETQTQLIQSEKMSAIGQLSAGIAHEIRNPLNIIEGARYYLSHILSESEKSESVNEYLTYIKQEVERTNKLITNLLKFSKSEAPRYELVDVNTTLENTLTLLKKQLSDGSVRGLKQFENSLPSILGDPNQLWQVFVNIIMNAIQAMPEGGDLTIKTFSNGEGSICVSFRDTGVGMDKDVVKKIFDPFFTRKELGTGLGLSISYSIVESHKGSIKVESEIGIGTDFRIELPIGRIDKSDNEAGASA
ncbi:MAG: GAF domain-containing protein [Candidatus Dadabacteria bacterium]|nr:GAF domain-containing protein [Candidatus Dadabacteria bacterium]NIV41593.1 GAF domain-containing protein [Candidatus Dadabacteria bacterium]NIX15155.1 GAF domain-containing protein [Candidatus Dadabacteria bacterium]NIY21800.1 GAF domain-containing protein [Candidatus Dadabacteria bacterium]